jgi:hypothetical protein
MDGRGVPRASTVDGEGIAGAAPSLLSRQELADLTGIEVTAKHEFILYGERLWHREADGWREYE